jgi:hypothetical protein
MAPKTRFTGVEAMQAKLRRIAQRFPERVARFLYREAEFVMTDSKQHYVPVAEVRGGTLRGGGYVKPPVRTGRTIRVELGYGGAAAAYALAIHEHPSPHSPPSWRGVTVHFHPTGHGPKYLERPLMKHVAVLAPRAARDLSLEQGG